MLLWINLKFSFRTDVSPKLLFASSGVKTHLYRFGAEHGNDNLKSFAYSEQGGPSLLDTILLSQWDNFAWRGHLDYDVTACQLKVIGGGRNFVGQLNNKWSSFSLKEYGKFFEAFRCLKPNSMKSFEGLLLCIAQGEKDRPEVAPSASPPKDGLIVIANAYPVEYGHIFLVPSAINQLSFYLDKKIFGLATKIAFEVNNAAFRVFFDSGTSVVSDRMFFQACYFASPLPVESAPTVTVYDGNTRSDIIVSETVDYPLKALVFTSNNLKALVNVVSEICFSLHDNNTAYSLLISNNGTKVFLFPQVKNLVTGCPLSAWECGGYFVYNTKIEFDNASETEILKRMAPVSLQGGSFEDLKHLCCAIANDLSM
ncbi:GDP-L-galactose phosphorylase 1 [Dichanthelium oligosanthes]|uniref:GDP-L-galactose phosphorylase 1 n=1 Tax=Dichanthelium oligosanthes TaxID=888268 RepID=A0A1E5VQW3_9POAL|nr:GDP-L-galactose phosphorylase 1 [Dichanthelium oligosanthes]